ncbi:MAG: hypothetical protein EBR82_10390 [Caulobacteraceae bacterium]|nr:hypothetical protein [Caulobacteraceae bacterium]
MNLTYTRPGELRKPDVEVLPDGRIRITRFIAAGHGDRDYSEVTTSVGTADNGLATALLVKKGMTRVENKDAIVLTYEVRNASTETPVGREDVQFGENGLKTVIADFVQMSSGTYTPQTVGTTTSTYDPTCVLRNEVMEDDGTTRQIRRFYINKGLINQVDEVRNNGALLIKTLVYLNDAPSPNPPSGYTLIATKVDNPGGLETTTYTFAKGDGKISEENETRNYGALFIRTIRWITAPGASNPIPAQAGYTSFSSGYVEQDGHRIWTSQFAQGSGQLSDQTETKYNGALYLRTIRYASDPTVTVNPITTPTGYTLVSVSESLEGGVKIWTAQYAKGNGQISRNDETKNNGALLIASIRYISDPSVSVNPITAPTGYVLISSEMAEQDGYRIWNNTYAKGNGLISSNQETRLSGMLLRTTLTYLTDPSVTTQPTSDPFGSGGTIVGNDVRDADGHRVWTVTWVKAVSTSNIIDSKETRNGGKLIIYRRQMLGTAPSAPAATIGGVVTLISDRTELQDGYTLYSRTWAEGVGQIGQDDETRNNGALLIRTIRHLTDGSVTANPITTPTGYTNVSVAYAEQDGYKLWTASYAKGNGQISQNDELKYNGALLTSTIRHLTAPSVSSNPITTPTGYTNISYGYVDQEGHRMWTASYAKGDGQISRDDEIKNNGALLTATIRHLTDSSVSSNPITTPTGYANISFSYAEQDGYRVWTASYAKGDGQVSRDDETKNNGALLIAAIRYLSAPSVSSNPIATPSGYTLISSAFTEQDGHRLWTASYAKGNGQISRDDEIKANGALLTATIRYLSNPSVSSNPITTPTGYINISFAYADQDGYRVWTASYAKGSGQISQDDEQRNNGKLLIRTIRQLSAPSVTSNPITTPGGYVLVSSAYVDQEGHRTWTASYASGSGQISQQDDTRNNGALLIRIIRHLTDPSTSVSPISTPTGYSLISSTYEDASGYRVWTGSFAKGEGIVTTGIEYKNNFKLAIHKATSLGSSPSTPSPVIGGTVVLIDSNTRQQDGYTLYDYTWAEGYGVVEKHIQTRDAGLRLETWVSVGGAYDASFMKPAGVLMMKDNQEADGFTRWTVTCMQSIYGGDPTSYSYSTQGYTKFNYPGRAGWATQTLTVGGITNYSKDLYLSPPVSALVLATTTISYQTSTTVGSLTYSLWNPTQWATAIATINSLASNGQPKSVSQGLEGYTAWSGYDTFSITAGSPSYSSVMGYWLAASSGAAGAVYGGPAMPTGSTTYTLMASIEKEPAFVAYDGTPYFRKVVITATPPAPGGVTP